MQKKMIQEKKKSESPGKLILVLNSGSSSLKYELIDMPGETTLMKGQVDAIGQSESSLTLKAGKTKDSKKIKVKDHGEAIRLALISLKEKSLIEDYEEISAVGHRVVHGGSKYRESVKITAEVLKDIKIYCALAPLHNPANLSGILACKNILKGKPQVAVFDTAFHQTMPEKAYTYPLPHKLAEQEGIRKYGFHGISHKYVSEKAYKLLRKNKGGVITCHLGNGCSVAAIQDGKSVDSSMGFTPAAGLFMGTRTGNIDPGIFTYLSRERNYTVAEWDNLINKESGLKGIAGTNDVRLIHERSAKDKDARLALDMFSQQIAFYIAGYSSSLKSLDAIVFTAGIGENASYIRSGSLDLLKQLGVRYDKKRNLENSRDISNPSSKVKVYVIPTNEELEIAKETFRLLG